MGQICYLIGDATEPQGEGKKIIAHICNDVGEWGAGFVLALSKKWKEPEEDYINWYSGGRESGFELGRTRFVRVEDDIWVANMIAQRDIKPVGGIPPIRYEALKSCLKGVAEKALELSASVHMPRIGCGLAGGTWDKVEPIIINVLAKKGVPVYVYDLKKI
ncbi:MAG: macro domain-containing protein [Clostridia bacterium]|nr:macro domain-containing protein [Clostridia bacterium]